MSGNELWKRDGTEDGTIRVKDLTPGPASSNLSELTAANNRLFFKQLTLFVDQLWTSDGTESGTVALQLIQNGNWPYNLTAVGNTLFFLGNDNSGDDELWNMLLY